MAGVPSAVHIRTAYSCTGRGYRAHLREWLARFVGQDDVHFALEGCTGWRYVVEGLQAAGIGPHLAEPADTAAPRGQAVSGTPKRTRPTPGI